MNCLIVDDEPIARDIIKTYCGHLPALHVVAECGNAFEAKTLLQEQKIDILFLDIHMPVLDGISFLKTLKVLPQLIFTTAYNEHAATAFDLAACDYLVKPFSLERFIIAVDKALEKLKAPAKQTAEKNEANTFFIKAEGKIYNLHYSDILYAEAKGNYTRIITTNTTILPAISFTAFEEMLPVNLFVRVHRSFIINKSRITHVEGNTVSINKVEIPVGSNYKEKFLSAIGL